jgi:hypothetical protein
MLVEGRKIGALSEAGEIIGPMHSMESGGHTAANNATIQ